MGKDDAAIAAGVPDPADIRLGVARGRGLFISLDAAMTMSFATAAARDLQSALGSDVVVFASPGGRGPVLTVLRLVGDDEAASLRLALEDLVAGFRRTAGALVERTRACMSPQDDYPESVRYGEATWYLYPHGEHCQFRNLASGEIVEAKLDAAHTLDPYFLLQYAKSAGQHDAIVNACVEGFHDMCRLLEHAGIAYG